MCVKTLWEVKQVEGIYTLILEPTIDDGPTFEILLGLVHPLVSWYSQNSNHKLYV